MNKSDLIEELANKPNLNSKLAEKVVNIFFDTIIEGLLNDERVELRGFSSFQMKNYAPYQGRNPKSGGAIIVKAKKLPFFKVGKELKELLNKDQDQDQDQD
ncbi:MAG: integration host factor subunit beta [Deltaproteobacteria bacterium]|jgi:integration host factor subunit beta|nr:integration host factor subunit beta [Deltaproteobacteria bacterium]